MGEINVSDAIDRLRSDKLKDRTEGVSDLKHILTQNRKSPKLETLNDKAYHKIYEAIFRAVSSEKSQYYRATKTNLKSQAASRLSSCASLLRVAVEAGCRKLKLKTVKAILDHVTQTLPAGTSGYCDPLSLDYIKSLRAVFDHSPHVEHLAQADWEDIADFCSHGLLGFIGDAPGAQNGVSPISKRDAEELIFCLQQLSIAPNSPVVWKAHNIVLSLMSFLHTSNTITRSHQAAFSTINTILCRILTENISLTTQIITDLFPLIRRLWMTKGTSLKEEMLVTLLLGQPYWQTLLRRQDSEQRRLDMEALLETILSDYSSRAERDILQLDDLHFHSFEDAHRSKPLRLGALSVRDGNLRAEANWSTIHVISSLIRSLDSALSNSVSDRVGEREGDSHKLRRRILHFDDIVRQIRNGTSTKRTCALQIAFMTIRNKTTTSSGLKSFGEDIIACLTDENSNSVSWAMLCITSCCYHEQALTSELQPFWFQSWNLASRNATSPSTCRVACHLMSTLLNLNLVAYSNISDSLDSMITSFDVNGPALFADSTVAFWGDFIHLRRMKAPDNFTKSVEQILHWFFSKWTPAKFTDRHFVAQFAQQVDVTEILTLLLICTGRPIKIFDVCSNRAFIPLLGPTARAHLYCQLNQPLLDYLLQTEESISTRLPSQNNIASNGQIGGHSKKRSQLLDSIIVKSVMTELQRTRDLWISEITDRTQFINSDMVRVLISSCIIGFSVGAYFAPPGSQPGEELREIAQRLGEDAASFITRQTCEQSVLDATLSAIDSQLPEFDDGILSASCDVSFATLTSIFHSAFKARQDSLEDSDDSNDPDFMDVDDAFDSQVSKSMLPGASTAFPRHNLAAKSDILALRECSLARISIMSQVAKGGSKTPERMIVSRVLVDYFTSLRGSQLLACGPFLREVVNPCTSLLTQQDASKLLEHLAEEILQSYEFERCEISMCICLDIVSGLADMVTQDNSGDLGEVSSAIYRWFIATVLENGIGSSDVYIGIASMLGHILKARPNYAKSLGLSSPRTSLFLILREGTIRVKYKVSQQISAIFGQFVLDEHDQIFGDVVDSLPTDGDHTEGIALRLLVLANLARDWYSLRRRAVYHIFETPGKLPESIPYASYCVRLVADALSLSSPRQIFSLFSTQILYTWFGSGEPLEEIPFTIFGFRNLAELLEEVKTEITAQLIMRGEEEQANDLAALLKTSYDDLLTQSFAKVFAYTIARDLSEPPLARSSGTSLVTGESRIRSKLGREQFLGLVQNNFASILAVLFKCMDHQDDPLEKAFSKRLGMVSEATILREIKAFGSSEKPLPPGQQPFFSSRYILDELEHVCKRTSYEFDKLWVPSLVTFVQRELLSTIHPSLGPLHACSVIRKIRILVALSEGSILEGYSLEMTLQALGSFLIDSNCAEDTIGLLKYLLQNGRDYLTKVPAFVAGLSLSLFATLKGFFKSHPDSTTQESQYLATISAARSFHDWLGRFVEKYQSPELHGDTETAFRAIMHSARNMRAEGNATVGTYESALLKELLDDRRSERNLLSSQSLRKAFSLICTDFQPPHSVRDDILGTDTDALLYGQVVHESCSLATVNDEYLLWAGRVLGRAYAASGHVPTDLTRETLLDRLCRQINGIQSSEKRILQSLTDLLSSEDQQEVGLAEGVLRAVIAKEIQSEQSNLLHDTLPGSLYHALDWSEYHFLPFNSDKVPRNPLANAAFPGYPTSLSEWATSLSIAVAQTAANVPIIGDLPVLLSTITRLSEEIFPYILHCALLHEFDGNQSTKRCVSNALKKWFNDEQELHKPHIRLLLNTLLYLRTKPVPNESTHDDREQWLDIEYYEAARAAIRCGMFKTALLFAEIESSKSSSNSRRSSITTLRINRDELLLEAFRNIEEPDSYYGVERGHSLATIMDRLEYEGDGTKSLAFRGSQYDSNLRSSFQGDITNSRAIIGALTSLDLNGISLSFLNSSQLGSDLKDSGNSFYDITRKLEQWDIPAPSAYDSESSTLFARFQLLNNLDDVESVSANLEYFYLAPMKRLIAVDQLETRPRSDLRTVAILTEVEDVLSCRDKEELDDMWARLSTRTEWMKLGHFADVGQILSCRETLFSSLCQRPPLRELVRCSLRDLRSIQIQCLLESSRISRAHLRMQKALNTVTYLSSLINPCSELGVEISAVVQSETSSILWDEGEITTSIQILHHLIHAPELLKQSISVGKAGLLARLGHQTSEARLEKPDEIMTRYLKAAVGELKNSIHGDEAGQVFHEYALFCDRQLQNSDNLQEFQRIIKLRQRKEEEVRDLEKMIKNATSQTKDTLRHYRAKAKQWLELDDREFRRLRTSREAFLGTSLENYLRALQACDTFNNDVVRFCALWLEHPDNSIANEAVSKYLDAVPSRKFATYMNQLSSRLLDVEDSFQSLLFSLVCRICVEHPYHGMHQVFAGSKTKGGKDEAALSRNAAAVKVVNYLRAHKSSSTAWQAIHDSNLCYVKLAVEKLDATKFKQGSKVPLRKSEWGRRLEQEVMSKNVPPPTMKIELRSDHDYSSVPVIVKFQPEMTIASGVSAPKIVTAIASDGKKYRQLFKGGNDDLRQDAIMEQVFEQVSNLLQKDRSTRQRNLRIRTYKVLPLTANAGVIEFVPDTMPLHDFLMPAHQKHFPKDWKPNACRKAIADVQPRSLDVRIKQFRQVTEHFHPVMRFFFFERFLNPDDWFERRLAYSRSTAAISILGHILGLGDRHGHNILLDEKTGEVVHIDLGVAFEQGRILPVPEVVPFRLTRDIVDGMGITKTEGVFRRCCEFTLEALRREHYSIMTILDVLRYDPLYSWSISPLRVKRMQEAQSEISIQSTEDAALAAVSKRRNGSDEGEADRALTVVANKLSKTLSVTATVNELIQQASDERNLAVLYCGWAAYA